MGRIEPSGGPDTVRPAGCMFDTPVVASTNKGFQWSELLTCNNWISSFTALVPTKPLMSPQLPRMKAKVRHRRMTETRSERWAREKGRKGESELCVLTGKTEYKPLCGIHNKPSSPFVQWLVGVVRVGHAFNSSMVIGSWWGTTRLYAKTFDLVSPDPHCVRMCVSECVFSVCAVAKTLKLEC